MLGAIELLARGDQRLSHAQRQVAGLRGATGAGDSNNVEADANAGTDSPTTVD